MSTICMYLQEHFLKCMIFHAIKIALKFGSIVLINNSIGNNFHSNKYLFRH